MPGVKGKSGVYNRTPEMKTGKHNKGRKRSLSTRKKMRDHALETGKKPPVYKKENHWNWKGGRSKEEISWVKNKRNRLKRITNKLGNYHSVGEWETLKAQYNWTCPACKKQEPVVKLTIDHIIPLSTGGGDNIENIQPLCKSCNCKKFTKNTKY